MASRAWLLMRGSLFGESTIVWVLGWALVLLAALGGGTALGQGAEWSQRERALEEPFRLQMDADVPTGKRALFDWGGWVRNSFWAMDEDGVDRDYDGRKDPRHVFRQQQLRLWGELNIDQVHQFYARMKLDYIDWNSGTSFNGDDSDGIGPNLERGWYDFRLSRAQKAYGWQEGQCDLGARIGRQFIEFGNGLALSVPLDAALVTAYCGDWEVTGMGAKTIPSSYNIDQSMPNNSRESRCFWGVQLRYNGWHDHEPFAYFFSQEDKDSGRVRETASGYQTFGYDSRYVGVGSRGRFFHRSLQYTCEFTGEFGKSHAWVDDRSERQNIRAAALDAELRYVAQDRHESQFSVEYLLASGDSDRWYSPMDTRGGNRPGTKDTSYVSWGYRNTGLVLAPRMSNLSVARLGMSTFPANHVTAFEELQVGSDFFMYHKQQKEGAASDSLSTEEHSYLGSEFDLFVNWRITSDLAWMVRYGVFWPGASFSEQGDRQLLFTSVTLNF